MTASASQTLIAIQKKATVLIVEDSIVQAKKLEHYLIKFGYNVISALNGKMAIEKLEKECTAGNPCDLIISDVQMPEMDGLQLLSALKEHAEYKRIPVIILTTLQEEAPRLKAFSLGANDFLVKPFQPEELQLRSKNLVALSQFERFILEENHVLTDELKDKNKLLEENLKNLRQAHEDLKALQIQLTHAAKMASLGTLSSGISHEINNPLAIIKGYNDQLADQLQRGEFNEDKIKQVNTKINYSIDRIANIVKNLRSLARGNETGTETLEINQLILDLSDFYTELAKKRNVEVIYNLATEKLYINNNNTLLQQAFLNLINNAIDAMENTSVRKLTLTSKQSEDKIYVTVSDTGCGIPPAQMNTIFDPFFTTKDPGKGMGLGLSLVYFYLKNTGGEISCQSSEKGTSFVVTLPVNKA